MAQVSQSRHPRHPPQVSWNRQVHTWSLFLKIPKAKKKSSFQYGNLFEVFFKMKITKNMHAAQCS